MTINKNNVQKRYLITTKTRRIIQENIDRYEKETKQQEAIQLGIIYNYLVQRVMQSIIKDGQFKKFYINKKKQLRHPSYTSSQLIKEYLNEAWYGNLKQNHQLTFE